MIAHVQRVEARLNQYDVYVKQLMNKTVDERQVDRVRDTYFEHVFEYVGGTVSDVYGLQMTYMRLPE